MFDELVAEHSHEPTADSELVKHIKSIIKVSILLFLLNLLNENTMHESAYGNNQLEVIWE